MSAESGNQASGRRVMAWILVAAVIVIAGASAALFPREKAGLENQPMTVAARGPLRISVIESGTIRPREQMILKNELEDPATILMIVEEGTQVKKGDLLCELDVTLHKNALTERKIRVQSAEAALIFAQENMKIAMNQGQADVDAAELAVIFARKDLQKYVEGEYPRLLKDAGSKITIAEEEMTRAKEVHNWSRTLFGESYLSKTELDRDELTMKKAELAVELAIADLDLLRRFTYERQMVTLESAVKQTEMALERTKIKVAASLVQAESDTKAKAALLEEERNKLKEIEDQLAKAKIYAPIDGMVLYASSSERWDDDDPPIREGTPVDERGEIIHLPTTSAYTVDTKILEVNLRKVRVGLPARILVDAMPGASFSGKVSRIAPLPDSSSRFLNPNLKLYNTVIEIESPDAALRNGMSCRVEIFVDEYEDAVSVPIQAVTRVAGEPVVFVVEDGRMVAKPVELGLDNSRVVRILSGLNGGETIALNPPLASGRDEQTRKGDKENGAKGEGENGSNGQRDNGARGGQGGGGGGGRNRDDGPRQAPAGDGKPRSSRSDS